MAGWGWGWGGGICLFAYVPYCKPSRVYAVYLLLDGMLCLLINSVDSLLLSHSLSFRVFSLSLSLSRARACVCVCGGGGVLRGGGVFMDCSRWE